MLWQLRRCKMWKRGTASLTLLNNTGSRLGLPAGSHAAAGRLGDASRNHPGYGCGDRPRRSPADFDPVTTAILEQEPDCSLAGGVPGTAVVTENRTE
ncbi:MAG: hypothetical protein R3D55_23035 [Chloroflexota bacterium]